MTFFGNTHPLRICKFLSVLRCIILSLIRPVTYQTCQNGGLATPCVEAWYVVVENQNHSGPAYCWILAQDDLTTAWSGWARRDLVIYAGSWGEREETYCCWEVPTLTSLLKSSPIRAGLPQPASIRITFLKVCFVNILMGKWILFYKLKISLDITSLGLSKCGIQNGDEYVITGEHDEETKAWRKVISFSGNGSVRTLPYLNIGRVQHACGKFENHDGVTVSQILSK